MQIRMTIRDDLHIAAKIRGLQDGKVLKEVIESALERYLYSLEAPVKSFDSDGEQELEQGRKPYRPSWT